MAHLLRDWLDNLGIAVHILCEIKLLLSCYFFNALILKLPLSLSLICILLHNRSYKLCVGTHARGLSARLSEHAHVIIRLHFVGVSSTVRMHMSQTPADLKRWRQAEKPDRKE